MKIEWKVSFEYTRINDDPEYYGATSIHVRPLNVEINPYAPDMHNSLPKITEQEWLTAREKIIKALSEIGIGQ